MATVEGVRARVPWWVAVSATAAPVVVVAAWSIAAPRQRGRYSSIFDTISALAARNAHDRWIMTAGLVALGVCYLVTAAGLRPARAAGRLLLAIGGVSALAVAAVPLPDPNHGQVALFGFVAMTAWPILAARSKTDVRPLRWPLAFAASAVLAGLLVWFEHTLSGHGGPIGLSERLLVAAQACWPMIVVLEARRSDRYRLDGGRTDRITR